MDSAVACFFKTTFLSVSYIHIFSPPLPIKQPFHANKITNYSSIQEAGPSNVDTCARSWSTIDYSRRTVYLYPPDQQTLFVEHSCFNCRINFLQSGQKIRRPCYL
ncbi:hypothetical protein Plhal304r1_c049g0130831 [Plasmopara halstedii]